jgi:type II secretory pathway pseudopilin PulG
VARVPGQNGLLVRDRLRKLRLRSEAGQGLIGLLIAMTVLVIGIGSTLTVFADSLTSLQQAGKEGTALTLADRQMETYRSMPYTCISSVFSVPSGCVTYSGFPNPYAPSQTTTSSESPDHRIYDVSTAITSATGSTYQIKISVTLHSSSRVLAQETSYFSPAGQSSGG